MKGGTGATETIVVCETANANEVEGRSAMTWMMCIWYKPSARGSLKDTV